MAKGSAKRPVGTDLDWYVISVQKLRQWGLILLVLLAAGIWGYYAYSRQHESVETRAQRDIREAARSLETAEKVPDASRFATELQQSRDRLSEARTAFSQKRFEEARNLAIESESLSQRVLGRPGGRESGDASLLSVDGDVSVQRAGRASWEGGRVRQPLYNGDFVRTGKSGSAEIMFFDGTLYQLRPESLFEVHRPAAPQPQAKSEVKMVQGQINVYTAQSGSTVKTDAAVAEIQRESRVGVDVAQDRSTQVSTFRGQTVLRTDRDSIVLGERERAKAEATTKTISPKIVLPEYPSPLDPADNKLYDLKSGGEVFLAWSSVKEADRYHLQISRSRLFVPDATVLDLADRKTPKAKLSVLDEGTYYWRVASITKAGVSSDFSPYRRFRVVADASKELLPAGRVPNLELQPPQQMGNLFLVFGKTTPGASVTVNNEPADVDPDGSFKKTVTIDKEGYSEIVIRASASGLETVRKQRVFVETF